MMQSQSYSNRQPKSMRLLGQLANLPNRNVVGGILVLALLAFEIFNFDTTRFALNSLLGEETRFWRIQWATILAIAFCSIDFAGLVQLFTPEKGADEPRETWYLMGAWLLGATMNAMMTWWAVSLTLLNRNLTGLALSPEQILFYVPIFVAVMVWLTRILFIGAFSLAGDHIFDMSNRRSYAAKPTAKATRSQPRAAVRRPTGQIASRNKSQPVMAKPAPQQYEQPAPAPAVQRKPMRSNNNNNGSRVRQRPPMSGSVRRMPLSGVQARGRNQQ